MAELEVRAASLARLLQEAGLDVPPLNSLGPGPPSTSRSSTTPASLPSPGPPTPATLLASPSTPDPGDKAAQFKMKQAMFASLPSGTVLSSLGAIPSVDLHRPKDDIAAHGPGRPTTPAADQSRFTTLTRTFSVEAIRARALKAESELSQVQQNLSTALERADTLETALKKRTVERDDLQRQMRTWKGELGELFQTVEELEKNLKATREQDVKSRTELEEMNRRLVEREGELEQERENIDQLSRVMSLLERQSEAADKTIEDLKGKVDHLKSRNAFYKQKLLARRGASDAAAAASGDGPGLEVTGFQTMQSVFSVAAGSEEGESTASSLERHRAESLAPFIEELRKTQLDLVTAHKQVVEKEDELRLIRLERTNLKTQLKDREKARRDVEMELLNTKKRLDEVEGELHILRRASEEGASRNATKLEQEVAQLRQALRMKDNQIDLMMKEAREALKAYMENADVASKDLPDIPESVVSSMISASLPPTPMRSLPLVAAAGAIEAELARLRIVLADREAEVAAVHVKLADAIEAKRRLEDSVRTLQAELEARGTVQTPTASAEDVEALKESISFAQWELDQSRARVTTLEQQVVTLTAQLGEMQTQREDQTAKAVELAVVTKSLQAKEAEVSELNAKLAEIERAAFVAQKENEGKLAALNAQMKQLQAQTFARSMGRSGPTPASDFFAAASMTLGAPSTRGLEIEREVSTLRAENLQLQARIARGEAEDKIVMSKMIELDRAASAAIAKSAQLTKEVQDLQTKSSLEQEEWAKASAAAEARIAALQTSAQEQRTVLEAALREAKSREESLLRRNADQGQRAGPQVASAEVEALKEDKRKLEARIAELSASIQSIEAESRKRISGLEKQLDQLSKARSSDQARIIDLQQRLEEPPLRTAASMPADVDEASKLRATLMDLQRKFDQLQKSEVSLLAQLEELRTGGPALFAIPAVAALKAQADSRREIPGGREAAFATVAELGDLKKRFDEAQSLLSAKDREIEALRQNVAMTEQLKNELDALRIKLDEGNKQLSMERKKAEDLGKGKAENDAFVARLQGQIKEMQQKLEQASTTHQQEAALLNRQVEMLARQLSQGGKADQLAAELAALRAKFDEGNKQLLAERKKAEEADKGKAESDTLVAELHDKLREIQQKLDQESNARRQETGVLNRQAELLGRQLSQAQNQAGRAEQLSAEVASLKTALEAKREQYAKLQEIFMLERQRRRSSNELLRSLQTELRSVKVAVEDMDDVEEMKLARTLSKLQEKHAELKRAAESTGNMANILESLAAENEAEAKRPVSVVTVPQANRMPMPGSSATPLFLPSQEVPQARQAPTGPAPPSVAPKLLPSQDPAPSRVALPAPPSSRSMPMAPPTSSSAPLPRVPPSNAPERSRPAVPPISTQPFASPKANPATIRMPSSSSIPDSPLSSFSSYLGSPVRITTKVPLPATSVPRITVPAYPHAPMQQTPVDAYGSKAPLPTRKAGGLR